MDSALFASQRQRIEDGIQGEEVPSLAVAVARDGIVLWVEAFGWANREAGIRASTETVYSLASVTKPMTATAVMSLVQHGLVELDRPVNDYLGDVQVRSALHDPAEATVRRVLNHSSGLPTHYQFFYADEPYTAPTADETIGRYGWLVSNPGDRYQYSNLGYGILGRLVEKVSGLPLALYLGEEVFRPLGMMTPLFDPVPPAFHQAAVRYGVDNVPYPSYCTDTPGASFVWCSIGDLLRFALHHLKTPLQDQSPVLTEGTIDLMQATSLVAPEPGSGADAQGLGWMITESDRGYRRVGFVGGAGGASSVLCMIPDQRIAIVALVNQSWRKATGLSPWLVAEDALGTLLPDYAERLAVDRARRPGQESYQPADSQQSLPPELVGTWRGTVATYVGPRTLTIRAMKSGVVYGKLEPNPLPIGGLEMLVNEARVEKGRLKGVMAGDIDTPDASRRSHNIELDLQLRGDVLAGAVAATSDRYWEDDGGAPRERIGNCLAYRAELSRATPSLFPRSL